MSQLKKIDYHNLVDHGTKSLPTVTQHQNTLENKDISGFEAMRLNWGIMDTKLKIEIIALFLVLITTIIMFVFYFMQKKEAYIPANFYAPGVEANL